MAILGGPLPSGWLESSGSAEQWYNNDTGVTHTANRRLGLTGGASATGSISTISQNNIDIRGKNAANSLSVSAYGTVTAAYAEVQSYDIDVYQVWTSNPSARVNTSTTLTFSDQQKPAYGSSATAPTGAFTVGDVIPITVQFSEPVKAATAKLTVNGSEVLSAAESDNTYSTVLTFPYTVKSVDNSFILLNRVSGAQDLYGNTMDEYSFPDEGQKLCDKQITGVRLLEAVDATPTVQTGDPTYYPASADQPERTTATVNVTLKLPTDKAQRDLIVPAYFDGAKYCSSLLAGSVDGGTTLLPLVLDSGTNPTTLTATAEFDARTLLNQQNFVMEFYRIDVDTNNGNAVTKGDLFFGRYAAFSVQKPVPLQASSLSIETPAGWPTAPIYANDPPAAESLTLTAKVENVPAGCTWTQTRWVSSAESIATIDASGRVFPLRSGTVEFYLEAVNGNLPDYADQRSQPVTLTVQEGGAPYLRIPESSTTIRAGEPYTLRWASNLVQKNAEYAANAPTVFTIQVFTGADTTGEPLQRHSVTYDPADQSDPNLWSGGSPNQSYTITGLDGTGAAGYTIVLSAEANAAVPGSKSFTAQAHVTVISQPVKVTLERPGKMFHVNTGVLPIQYSLERYDAEGGGAAFELVVTNNATGQPVYTQTTTDITGGSFTLDLADAAVTDGFRTLYDVSVKAKNTAEKDWSRDSFTLYIYDKDCLDILVQPVENGRVTVSGGKVTLSNEAWIAPLSQEQILALQRDIDLQAAISINYGDHAWGEASDRIAWASRDNNIAAINYPQGACYENIEGLPYTSYAPATQFLLSGKNDGTTVVDAIHALAGDALSASVEINVETLKDKLYLFQFYPASAATLTYTNGDGETKTHQTDGQGQAAVYEASGIASDIYVKAEVGDDVYLGTVFQETLVSQEKDAVSLELYPLNSLVLRKAATLPIYLKNPDGTNYRGRYPPVRARGQFGNRARWAGQPPLHQPAGALFLRRADRYFDRRAQQKRQARPQLGLPQRVAGHYCALVGCGRCQQSRAEHPVCGRHRQNAHRPEAGAVQVSLLLYAGHIQHGQPE
ncbi:MAG: hypothetical protein SO044_06680 [Agathobaculum sp.]|uniref:Ig-like domain-containing protein n=1 Tax=Agathobaculum sp. TaxID=2048138 RepID=UPI002A80178C|nr:hypothetical protein [Agathobaculum sp.]MDY3712080.1 hypothetical protein [Agathobaculum sp.]